MQDYYSILGLKQNASKDEIRKAYRKLAMQYHPDKNPSPNAKQKFIEITEAYDALISEKTFFRKASPKTESKPVYKTNASRPTAAPQSNAGGTYQQYDYMRKKFLELKRKYNHPNYKAAKKKELYKKSNLYFVYSGSVLLVAILFPILISNSYLLIATLPAGLGFALRLFWFAGQKRMRADMLFSNEENYSLRELQDFFGNSEEVGMRFGII